MKSYIKKFFPFLVSGLIVVIIFTGGYFVGKRNSNSLATVGLPSVTNPTDSTHANVDFSPFWKAWSLIDSNFVSSSSTRKFSDQEKVWGAIKGLTASYGDPYTVFFPPDDLKRFQDDIQGNFEGVGIEIVVKDSILTVVSPLKGTPAYKAGMKAKDQILKIDGKSTSGMSTEEATKLIRGTKGTTVVFTINRDGKQSDIKVVRDVIDVPIVESKLRDDGVFVISFYSFSANSPDKFRDALREFVKSGSNKMVLDLRGNPGGYLEAAVDVASWFLPASDIVVKEDFGDKNKPEEIFKSKGYNIFTDKLKLVILIDEGSASASEILAGALKENGKATLVGVRSFGKGSVQELMPLTDDTSIKVTIAHWFTPSGKSISENGIEPDISVKVGDKDKETGYDTQLEKAAQVLLEK